jgi:hypothetical protein
LFIAVSVAGEFFQHGRHFVGGKQHRLAELAGAPVLFAEFFEFDGEGQRFVKIAAGNQQAVVGEQAGVAIFHGGQCCGRQQFRAKNGVVGAADGAAAEAGDHVMKRRNVEAQAGQADRER